MLGDIHIVEGRSRLGEISERNQDLRLGKITGRDDLTTRILWHALEGAGLGNEPAQVAQRHPPNTCHAPSASCLAIG